MNTPHNADNARLCPEKSPVTCLPCTRKRGHQSEPIGALCVSGDGRAWTSDPWSSGNPDNAPSAPTLVRKPLAQIIAFWRPGSHDWSWADEYADLMASPVTAAVLKRVSGEGIDFADQLAPVLLGSDGRVWDGHHRICIALMEQIPYLMVEVAAPGTRPEMSAD